MKKLLGTLVAGAVILVPTAAMAGTTSTTTSTDTGAGVIADPIFVVSPTPLPDAQPAPVVPVLTPKEEKKAAKEQAKDDKKAAHELAKAKQNKRAEHELRILDDGAQGPVDFAYQDPSLVRNGGWKLS